MSLIISSQPQSLSFNGLVGLDSTNYYHIATGSDLDGNGTGFEILQVSILNGTSFVPTLEFVISSFEFLVGGWALGVDSVRPQYRICNAAGNDFGLGIGSFIPGLSGQAVLVSSVAYDGANRLFKINGQTLLSVAMADFGPGTLGVRIGANPDGSFPLSNDATVLAIGAKTDGILSNSDWTEQLNALYSNGDLVNGSLTSRYSIKDLPLGAAPATLEDEIGSNDFTLTGALTIAKQGFNGFNSYTSVF